MTWVQYFGEVLDEDSSSLLTNVEKRNIVVRNQLPPRVPFVAGTTALEISESALVSENSAATMLVPSTANGGNLLGDRWTDAGSEESGAWIRG